MRFALCLILLSGCARFSTRQTDISTTNEYGQPKRTITTTATATTFWDSSSALAKFKANQTDKSQSASVGTLDQTATSTNVNTLVESVVSGAVQGAVKATAKP